MILGNLPRVPPRAHHVVEKLVPERQGCEARAGEFCNRGQVEAVEGTVGGVEGQADEGEGDEGQGCEGGEEGGGEGDGHFCLVCCWVAGLLASTYMD